MEKLEILKQNLINLTIEYSEKHLGENNIEQRRMKEDIEFLTTSINSLKRDIRISDAIKCGFKLTYLTTPLIIDIFEIEKGMRRKFYYFFGFRIACTPAE